MTSVKSAKDVTQAVIDHIEAGTYQIAFTAKRVATVEKKLREVEGVELVAAYDDRSSTRSTSSASRQARDIRHAVRVGLMSEPLKTTETGDIDPLTDLLDDIEARLMSSETTTLVLDDGKLYGMEIQFENGYYDREALRDNRVFVSEFTIEYLAPGANL